MINFFVIANTFLLPNVYETKKVGHEQGLSVQLSIVGHFFPRRPPKRNYLGTSLQSTTSFSTVFYSLLVTMVPNQCLIVIFIIIFIFDEDEYCSSTAKETKKFIG